MASPASSAAATTPQPPQDPHGSTVTFERERGVTEVRVTRGLAHVTISFPSGDDVERARLDLLEALADAGISLFLVKLHPSGISFAVRAAQVDACETLLTQRQTPMTLLRDLSLVATLAGAMRDLSGVMARIYEATVGAGVRVRQTGDAYNAVLCLVDGEDTDRAADALRKMFSLSSDDGAGSTTPMAREGVGLKAL